MHLSAGLAADGTRVLSAASVAAMTEFQADVPDKYILGDSWGIGWIRFGWDGQRLVGHDGNTIGQAAFLRVLPEAGLAVTLLTNGGNTRDLYEDLYREIFAELAGVDMPTPITPPAEPVDTDITPHLGSYERAGVLMEILASTDDIAGPALRTTLTGPLAELTPEPAHDLPDARDRPGPVRDPRAGGSVLGAAHLLRPGDGGEVPALRCPCHPEGELTWSSRRWWPLWRRGCPPSSPTPKSW